MADKHQRARVIFQRQVQGLDGFHVQVVGGLVHQHDVGLFQDQFAEQHAALLTTRNNLHRFTDIIP